MIWTEREFREGFLRITQSLNSNACLLILLFIFPNKKLNEHYTTISVLLKNTINNETHTTE